MQVQSLGWEDFPRGRNGNPLQYSCLENPTNRGALQATVHGIAESNMTEQLHFHFISFYSRCLKISSEPKKYISVKRAFPSLLCYYPCILFHDIYIFYGLLNRQEYKMELRQHEIVAQKLTQMLKPGCDVFLCHQLVYWGSQLGVYGILRLIKTLFQELWKSE